ncbi:MAG TPA: aminotransferase class I/II-fold pyridoxal phosphate-dependent enzyme, partial [Ferruginibacter sp.]|nr:aminotransferase class I/II-fold pyridoxal phosphate-dependent enzyme [Ferruginibacter sp.]
MTPTIISRLPQVGTTIFTVMSSLAAEHQAINLGQGFPDFPMNEALVELVYQAMRAGHNQYVHMNGLPLLRERIAEKIADSYGISVHPDSEITVTPGGTYAIYTALTALLQPGDEVILFEPAYDSYIPNIELNGGVVVPIALKAPGFRIPWAEVWA